MSKKIKTLEKETTTWKSKWERSNAALIDLMSEKQVRDEHIMKTARQLFQLQKLCRTLQNERTAYFKALEENKIEIPQIVEVPCQMPEPEQLPIPTKKQEDRLEIMTKNCSALKENLAALQGQLSAMKSAEEKNDESLTVSVSSPASVTGQTQSQGKKNKRDKKGKGAKPAEPQVETKAEVDGVEAESKYSKDQGETVPVETSTASAPEEPPKASPAEKQEEPETVQDVPVVETKEPTEAQSVQQTETTTAVAT